MCMDVFVPFFGDDCLFLCVCLTDYRKGGGKLCVCVCVKTIENMRNDLYLQ